MATIEYGFERPLRVDTQLMVETPEGVDFQFELAGPGRRGLAMAIDMLFVTGFMIVVFFIAGMVTAFGEVLANVGMMFVLLIFFTVKWFYSALFEGFMGGRTPGKAVMHLRVLRTNGTPVGFLEAFGRGLVLAADWMPGAFTTGVVVMMSNRQMRRLGDLFFDTMVIDESSELLLQKSLDEHSAAPLERSSCHRTYSLAPRTIAVIERLIEQTRPISPLRREELAVPLANAISRHLGYSPDGDAAASAYSPVTLNSHSLDCSQFPATCFLIRVRVTFSPDDQAPEYAQSIHAQKHQDIDDLPVLLLADDEYSTEAQRDPS